MIKTFISHRSLFIVVAILNSLVTVAEEQEVGKNSCWNCQFGENKKMVEKSPGKLKNHENGMDQNRSFVVLSESDFDKKSPF